ncbi:MFS transporter [Cellulosimicrobium composti]|uniref:MFS transporter n=1 Tax=Cellulosimicrobium composti TaxID=2672572 RepID=A0ABX0BDU2_9MICO|nr:MFS transporter [Cellulosimicrobium composti]NDO90302.1 MFS transporter [Cellulosimicrobium composti]
MPTVRRRTRPRTTARTRAGLGVPFRNVFTANLSSSLGDGVARVAAPLLAARLTDDPLLVGGVAAASLLPWLFLAIPAGVLLDRVDRRHALALANGARTLLALGLVALAATGTLTIWWLFAVVFLYGALETVYDGAIRAVLPSIVAPADLPHANSRIEAGEITVQNFLAQPLTSALFAVAVVVPLGTGAAAYAVAGALALFLPAVAAGEHRTPGPDGAEPAPAWFRQLGDGFRYLWAHPTLRPLWILSTVVALCFSAATATTVLYVLDVLGVPEAWYGTFLLVGAVGSLVAAAVVNRAKERFGTGRSMAAANLLSPLTVALLGLVPLLPSGGVAVAAALLAVGFGAVTLWNVLVMSLRQAMIPGRLLGRVHGTWRTLLWGVMPLGSFLGGLLARVDLTTPLLVGGGLGTLAALVGYRFVAGLPDPEDVDQIPERG